MKYFVLTKEGKEWLQTWWTDSNPPETGYRGRRRPRPAKNRGAAIEALRTARKMYPQAKYKIFPVEAA